MLCISGANDQAVWCMCGNERRCGGHKKMRIFYSAKEKSHKNKKISGLF